MGLATGRIAEGDALHDEPSRRGSLRGGDEVARAFDADTRIAWIGRTKLGLVVEGARQICQLVDDDVRLGVHHGALKRAGVEHVDGDGENTVRFERACSFPVTRHAGDAVACGKQ